MKCGCVLKIYNDDFGEDKPRIIFCPLHAAAEEMLAELNVQHQAEKECYPHEPKNCGSCFIIAKAERRHE